MVSSLILTAPRANSTDNNLMIFFFFFFFRKQGLTFHANCLLRRQFALNIKHCYLEQFRKIFQNVVCWLFFFDCVSGMCNYYFCKHLMKYCRGESYYHTSFLRELNYIPDNLSVSSQSDDRNSHSTCCTPILGAGADTPVRRIISLWFQVSFFLCTIIGACNATIGKKRPQLKYTCIIACNTTMVFLALFV